MLSWGPDSTWEKEMYLDVQTNVGKDKVDKKQGAKGEYKALVFPAEQECVFGSSLFRPGQGRFSEQKQARKKELGLLLSVDGCKWHPLNATRKEKQDKNEPLTSVKRRSLNCDQIGMSITGLDTPSELLMLA